MDDAPLRVILLANWGLGLSILEALDKLSGVTVVGVITQHDPVSDDPWKNAVYECAVSKGYDVISQEALSHDAMEAFLGEKGADLLFVHGYNRILPRRVFETPRNGSVNIHSSLLPRHRGPSPTKWVLHNGETKTGMTAHFIDDGLDTGPIIHQVGVDVVKGDTMVSIIDKMKQKAFRLVEETFRRLRDPSFIPEEQNESDATYESKPKKVERDV